MRKEQREIKLKLGALNHAKTSKSISQTCQRFGISRQSFYTWKANYEKFGEDGLINKAPIPKSHPSTISPEIQEIIIHLKKRITLSPNGFICICKDIVQTLEYLRSAYIVS